MSRRGDWCRGCDGDRGNLLYPVCAACFGGWTPVPLRHAWLPYLNQRVRDADAYVALYRQIQRETRQTRRVSPLSAARRHAV